VPFLKIHQLLSVHIAVGGFLDQALCSWWIFRIGSSQSVDFHKEGLQLAMTAAFTKRKHVKNPHSGGNVWSFLRIYAELIWSTL